MQIALAHHFQATAFILPEPMHALAITHHFRATAFYPPSLSLTDELTSDFLPQGVRSIYHANLWQ